MPLDMLVILLKEAGMNKTEGKITMKYVWMAGDYVMGNLPVKTHARSPRQVGYRMSDQASLFDPDQADTGTPTHTRVAVIWSRLPGREPEVLPGQRFQPRLPQQPDGRGAAEAACISLTSEYVKRCKELREDGVIAVVRDEHGQPLTRPGASGNQRIVSIYIPKD